MVLFRLFAALDPTRFQTLSIVPETGPAERRLKEMGIPVAVMDLRPVKRPFIGTAATLARLQWLCLGFRPDLVHANDPYVYRLLSCTVGRKRRVCSLYHPDVKAQSLRWAFRRRPAAVFVPSAHVADVVRTALGTPFHVPLFNTWTPIDTEWFQPPGSAGDQRQKLGIDPAALHVSIVASLSPHKGHECFLRTAKRLTDAIPNVSFSVVGGLTSYGAEYAAHLRNRAIELGISHLVRFWGHVDDATVRDVIAASDVFLLPTKEEGFGMAVAEAQACGVPVLTSAIPPLHEIVLDGQTGYLCAPEDDEAFGRIALDLLRDPEKRRRIGRAGVAFVGERFSSDSYMRRVVTVYESVLRGGAPLPS